MFFSSRHLLLSFVIIIRSDLFIQQQNNNKQREKNAHIFQPSKCKNESELMKESLQISLLYYMCVGKRRITVKKKAKQREQLEEKECVSHCVQKSQSSFQKRKETLGRIYILPK